MYDMIVATRREREVTADDFLPFLGRFTAVELEDCVDLNAQLVSVNTLLNVCDIVAYDGIRRTFPAGDLATRIENA